MLTAELASCTCDVSITGIQEENTLVINVMAPNPFLFKYRAACVLQSVGGRKKSIQKWLEFASPHQYMYVQGNGICHL